MFVPDWLEETERLDEFTPGVFERKVPNRLPDEAARAHYGGDAERILRSDRGHYEEMMRWVRRTVPELVGRYQSVRAVGGGHPKLEVMMEWGGIVVEDEWAELYAEKADLFRKHFPGAVAEWRTRDLAVPSPSVGAEVTTFVHFLEHLTFKQAKAWLETCGTDVLVYGPNIAAARNERWFHFSPVDHNHFALPQVYAEVLEKAGYTVRWWEYADDLMVWGRRSVEQGAGSVESEWQEIDGLECEKCGHSPVEVMTPLRDGWVREDDPARCPDCGATGTVWLGGHDIPSVYYAGGDDENA